MTLQEIMLLEITCACERLSIAIEIAANEQLRERLTILRDQLDELALQADPHVGPPLMQTTG